MRKNQALKKTLAVCATVLVTVGILCQARASTADAKEVISKDDDHYIDIEWIIPETPPLPPVLKDGKWFSWEEVFGPLPKPKPAAVKRPRGPKPPAPSDPSARWLAKKRELAPQLFADGKLKPEAEAMFTKGKEAAFAKVKNRKSPLRPKVDAFDPQPRVRSQISQAGLLGGPQGAYGPQYSRNPRLEIVAVDDKSSPGWTYVELWLIDGPQDVWWDVFRAPTLQPNAWTPLYSGPPAFAFDNIQVFPFLIPGQSAESYFQVFLHQDSDFDGLPDGYEVCIFKTDPNNPDSASTRDADGDGQPDYPHLAGNRVADGD